MICLDNSPKKISVRLAALFHDVGKPATRELTENGATFYGHDKLSAKMASKALKRLKYANDTMDDVTKLISRHMFSEGAGEKGVRRLVRSVGKDLIFDLLDLRQADTLAQGMGQDLLSIDEFKRKVVSEIEKKRPFGFADLAVNGDDLIREFDLAESPLIGDILGDLLEMVLDNPDLNTRERLLNRAREYLSQKRS
jgi:putative nucleotidyltransferase with HDIG domain